MKVWEMPEEEQYELFRCGIFDGLNKSEALEEAYLVLCYWLHGAALGPIE